MSIHLWKGAGRASTTYHPAVARVEPKAKEVRSPKIKLRGKDPWRSITLSVHEILMERATDDLANPGEDHEGGGP
jgi:hypothetical protein